MDALVRCLREGRLEQACAGVAVILDDAQTCGGLEVFDQVLRDLTGAVAAGRSQATRVHALAVDRPPSELAAAGVASITDVYSDACGWLANSSSSSSDGEVQWRDLQALRELAKAGADAWAAVAGVSAANSCCLVVAGLSTLLLRHSTMQVLQVLHQLKACPQVSSMLLSVHTDLHDAQLVAALQALSSTTLQLQPLSGLQHELAVRALGHACHGSLRASSKRRRLGRLRVEHQLYRLLPHGGLQTHAPPAGLSLDARALVEGALSQQMQQQQQRRQPQAAGRPGGPQAPATAASGVDQTPAPGEPGELLARKLGGMRLDVSEQEQAAKAAVQLPYVHQGAGRAYASGDARQYLPPAAGGCGPGVDDGGGSGKLGHILYVRDSDEEHDSDEDPDDDLDI